MNNDSLIHAIPYSNVRMATNNRLIGNITGTPARGQEIDADDMRTFLGVDYRDSVFLGRGRIEHSNSAANVSLLDGNSIATTGSKVLSGFATGDVIRFWIGGEIGGASSASGVLTFEVSFGGTTPISIVSDTDEFNGNTPNPFVLEGMLSIRDTTTPAASTIYATAALYASRVAVGNPTIIKMDAGDDGTVDLSGTATLDILGDWNTAHINNLIRVDSSIVERMNPSL